MLDKGISFSLYMTHGGTTFGWWGGANNPAYSAMCSSYDYDAPISEAGWTTDKYFALRDMLKNYLQEGEKTARCASSTSCYGGTCHQVYTDCSVNQQSPDTETDRRYQTDGEIRSGLGNHSLPH